MATLLPTAATPVERILSRFGRKQIEAFISIAIDICDTLDGDPDLEDGDPCCLIVDDRGNSLLPNGSDYRTEDDEDSDEDLEHDGREPDAAI